MEVEIRLRGYQSKRWKKELTQPCTRGDWTWWKAEGLSEKLSSTAILCVRWEQADSKNYKTQSACLQLNARNSGRNFGPSSITHHPRSKIVAQKEIFETCAAATVPFSCRMSILQCLKWTEILASKISGKRVCVPHGAHCAHCFAENCVDGVCFTIGTEVTGVWFLSPHPPPPPPHFKCCSRHDSRLPRINKLCVVSGWVGGWWQEEWQSTQPDTAICNCWKVTKIARQEVLYLEIVQRESCCVTQDCNEERTERDKHSRRWWRRKKKKTQNSRSSAPSTVDYKRKHTHTLKALRVWRL